MVCTTCKWLEEKKVEHGVKGADILEMKAAEEVKEEELRRLRLNLERTYDKLAQALEDHQNRFHVEEVEQNGFIG